MSSNDFQQLTNKCKQMLQNGKNIDDVLEYLRAETHSKGDSGIILMDVLNISSREAKLLVHTSKAWRDVKERDEEIHEKFISEIEKIRKGK